MVKGTAFGRPFRCSGDGAVGFLVDILTIGGDETSSKCIGKFEACPLKLLLMVQKSGDHQLIIWSLSHYLQGFLYIPTVVGNGISEPSSSMIAGLRTFQKRKARRARIFFQISMKN